MTEPLSKKQRVQRALRTVAGGIMLMVGIVAIPYPGPGWLIVFTGLAILARDYPAAQRILDNARVKYDKWQLWVKKQSLPIQAWLWAFTTVVVVLTIWLVNGYGFINSIFNLGIDWLVSPLVR
ncbi:TIGR02611 family protein [Candidatus Saccharibacteria bacterium]|nr:TIGR02611 family protein [Candidatus Saccharibacteria bacterium]